MSIQDILVYFELASFLVGAVWAISKIQSMTERLGDKIGALGNAIEKLEKALGIHEQRLNGVIERLAKLEGRLPD